MKGEAGSVLARMAALVITAVVLTALYQSMSVYFLGNVDPKFGARGTIELSVLIVFVCSLLAALGNGISHWVWGRGSTGGMAGAVIGGIFAGTAVAVAYRFVLFDVPVVDGVSDAAQQCVYFIVLGILLHQVGRAVPAFRSVRALEK